LFLRAQQEGIGHIPLEKITLSSNFRSEKSIIDWVNQTFENIFPTIEDIAAGAVSYAKSTPGHSEKNASEDSGVYHHMNLQSIIEIIQQKASQESLAILVKARSHLNEIIPLLRQHNIPYQAIEIDRLANKPCIQDLLSLTKALLHPADRVSWLSLLRAPFYGLTLNSLLQIAEHDPNKTIYDSLNLTLNNTDDQTRLNHFKAIIDQAFACRFDNTLREWIESTWKNFQGHHCFLNNNESIVDADIFFNELENFDFKTVDLFEQRINELRASTQEIDKNAIQIMTIHKAKGLEFDIVILPGLEHSSRPPENQLLRWMERPRTHRENDLILAPIRAFKDTEDDSINRYLKFEEKLKTQLEDQRQFYVAATRAKKQLHLIAKIKDSTKSPSNSFLSMIWPQFNAILSMYSTTESIELPPRTPSIPTLRRLKTITPYTECALKQPQPHTHITETDSCHKKIGTLIHRILQQIASDGPEHWPADRILTSKSAWKTALIRLGVLKSEIDLALEKVALAIKNTLNDEKGRWTLSSHKDAKSELPITVIENHQPKNYIIDRTFIGEKGIRWIIDFKCTETDPDENTINNYQQQLRNYGEIIHQLYGEKNIQLALYFPNTSNFRCYYPYDKECVNRSNCLKKIF
jgi:ATP-dependent exoDNAse (exonuclease V) beta subunit